MPGLGGGKGTGAPVPPCVCTVNASSNGTDADLPACCSASVLTTPLVAQLTLVVPLLICICYLIHLRNKYDERKERERRSRDMMNDMEVADVGIEMSEMNPAAQAAAAEARASAEEAQASAGDDARQASASGGDAPQASTDAASNAASGSMAGVKHELQKLRLDQYCSKFEQLGYDFWPEIQRLPPKRFAKLVHGVGMSANHCDRLKEALADQRKKLGIGVAREGH